MIDPVPFWWHLDLYRWQDGIEILLLSGLLYYLSRWLSQDTQKPLLAVLYGYCTLLYVSDYLYLSTINALLLLFLPILCAVLLLIHRNTLQKNFVTLHALTPQQKPAADWIELLVRGGLSVASDNRPFTCALEKSEALDSLLIAPYRLDAPISLELFNLLKSSTLFHSQQFLWINTHAHITAYNCSWQKNSVTDWLLEESQAQEPWLREALFFTTKADTLVLHLAPETRTFTLVAQGKIIEKVTAQQACNAIRKYLGYPPHAQGEWHVPVNKTISSTNARS